MQNVNGTMTKVYTEPVPTTFSKDQVAGYESFSSQEYYRLAYEIAGDIIGGEYGIHKPAAVAAQTLPGLNPLSEFL